MEGITNRLFKKDDVEEVYNQRLEICKSCEFIDNKGDKCAIPGTSPCCSSCGCSLSLKLRSLNTSCPEGKWGAVLTDIENALLDRQINPEKYENE